MITQNDKRIKEDMKGQIEKNEKVKNELRKENISLINRLLKSTDFEIMKDKLNYNEHVQSMLELNKQKK